MKRSFFQVVFLLLSFSIFAQNIENDTILLVSENVYFDFGKDEIRDSEINKLNQFAQKVQGDIDGFIRLTGHTDAIGTDDNNNSLSERRATNVIQYLVSQRIAPLSFYTSFDGERKPVADNDSDDGRQLNRRVEINVYQIKRKELVEAKPVPKPEPKKEVVEPVKVDVPMTLISFQVKDEETDRLIDAKIIYKQYISDEAQELMTNPTGLGKLDLELKENTKMSFDFYAEGYFHNSEEVLIKKGTENLVAVTLKPIKKGNKLALKNLYFYGNQAKLLPKSIPELKRLKNSLAMNPNAVVEIGGHINYPNTHPDDVPEWSVILSQRRAEVIYKYLVDSGIEANRLRHKGYSNTQMVNPKATKEIDMAPNRRVEIKVLEYLDE